ncbi:MAG: hypothetical protein M0021_09730 [Clostridia bacterium]|nr:hypothetical protein [Clostridia bacterium]
MDGYCWQCGLPLVNDEATGESEDDCYCAECLKEIMNEQHN